MPRKKWGFPTKFLTGCLDVESVKLTHTGEDRGAMGYSAQSPAPAPGLLHPAGKETVYLLLYQVPQRYPTKPLRANLRNLLAW